LVRLTSVFATFLAYSFIGTHPSVNAAPPEPIGNDEYAVYSAVIRERVVGESVKVVLIVNETEPELIDFFAGFKLTSDLKKRPWTLDEKVELMKQSLPSLSQSTVDDYLSKNARVSTLIRKFELSVAYRLLNRREAIERYQRPAQPAAISEIVTLSRAGFDEKKNQALMHLTTSGGTDGESFFFLLTKMDRRWSVVGRFGPM